MATKQQINLRIDADTKRLWEEYVADSHVHESVTGLIRVAVANEITGSAGGATDENGDTAHMGEVLDGLRHIQTDLSDLRTRMRSVERAVEHRPDLMEVATDLFGRLPTEEPGTEPWEARVASYTPEEHTVWPGTPRALAEAVEETESVVRDALERLQADTHRVRVTEVGGEPRWWRSE